MPTKLTWLGSNAFHIQSPSGLSIYIDPWLENSDCPESERKPRPADVVALTHGHFDHVGQCMDIWRLYSPRVVAPQDLRRWLEKQGLPHDHRDGPDIGGTIELLGLSISLTDARHSGGAPDGSYGGAPCGMVLKMEDGLRLYFAGDTGVFGDMALIARMYEPDIAVLPIGGHFTMDPRGAAIALELLNVRRCIPCHYRFGEQPRPPRAVLPGKPSELRRLVGQKVEIIDPAPGQTIELS